MHAAAYTQDRYDLIVPGSFHPRGNIIYLTTMDAQYAQLRAACHSLIVLII